jgi:predicted transcriptional regulator
MRNKNMNTKIINALITMGLNEKESKVLSLLMDNKLVVARDFERLLDMRQPEVSLALKNLQSRGWVRNGDKLKSDKMLRAGKTYGLCYSIEEITTELKKQAETKNKEFLTSIKTVGGR